MNKQKSTLLHIRKALGYICASIALFFFVWFFVGWLSFIPSLLDVFGIEQLRIPAGIVVGSLLLAAICFDDFG